MAQYRASKGYKHKEHTPGICIVRMHTINTDTRTQKSHQQLAKSYMTETMPRRIKNKKKVKKRATSMPSRC